jgi:hypothetical protein
MLHISPALWRSAYSAPTPRTGFKIRWELTVSEFLVPTPECVFVEVPNEDVIKLGVVEVPPNLGPLRRIGRNVVGRGMVGIIPV